MGSFNPSEYAEQLLSVKQKQDEIAAAQAARDAELQRVADVRNAAKAKSQQLLALKKGVDLRSEEKKARVNRTMYLREVGILLPNEEICKVREPRKKS